MTNVGPTISTAVQKKFCDPVVLESIRSPNQLKYDSKLRKKLAGRLRTWLHRTLSNVIVLLNTRPKNFLRSSCIRVDQLTYDSKPTEIREQYHWMAEKIERAFVPGTSRRLRTPCSGRRCSLVSGARGWPAWWRHPRWSGVWAWPRHSGLLSSRKGRRGGSYPSGTPSSLSSRACGPVRPEGRKEGNDSSKVIAGSPKSGGSQPKWNDEKVRFFKISNQGFLSISIYRTCDVWIWLTYNKRVERLQRYVVFGLSIIIKNNHK